MRDSNSTVRKRTVSLPATTRLILVGATISILTITGLKSGILTGRGQALADSTKVVSIYVDGEKHVVSTDAETVGDMLKRLNIHLASDDIIEPPLETKIPSGFFNINIYRARSVMVIDGATTKSVRTASQSPRQIAVAAGFKVYPEDEFTSQVVTNFVDDGAVGQKVIIRRAKVVHVAVDGHKQLFRTQALTVGEFLAGTPIKLGLKDTLSAAKTASISPEMTVAVTRVSDVETTVSEVLPHTVKTVTDATVPKGTSVNQVAGSDGHRQVTYRIHYRDGVEISRETLAITSIVQPVTQVIVVGTKIMFSGSIEHWRPYVIEAATAYGVDPNLMLAIMKCESNGNANASNGSHFGLYQYSAETWASYGNARSSIFDGPTQIRVTAGRLSKTNGTSPWLASKYCWSSIY